MPDEVNSEEQEQSVPEGQQVQDPSETQPVDAESLVPAPPSPAPVEVAPQPTESIASQFLTQEQLEEALEQQRRQFQSIVDKSEYRSRQQIKERFALANEVLDGVRDYLGADEAQARRNAENSLVADYYRQDVPEPQEPSAPTPEQVQAQARDQAIIETTVQLTGIKPGDADYVEPSTTQNPAQWRNLMQQAAQRRANTPPKRQPPVPQPAQPAQVVPELPEPRPAPVTIVGGEAPRRTGVEELSAAISEANKQGNMKLVAELRQRLISMA